VAIRLSASPRGHNPNCPRMSDKTQRRSQRCQRSVSTQMKDASSRFFALLSRHTALNTTPKRLHACTYHTVGIKSWRASGEGANSKRQEKPSQRLAERQKTDNTANQTTTKNQTKRKEGSKPDRSTQHTNTQPHRKTTKPNHALAIQYCP